MAAGWRGFFEARFGTSFTDVRLGADAPAARTAAALGAHAFTLGRDIYFAGGQLAPATPAGTHLLAHEPAHVAPQRTDSRSSRPARSRARSAIRISAGRRAAP